MDPRERQWGKADKELADRLEVRDVIERYSDAVTHRLWADAAATFHEDAVWKAGAPISIELKTRDGIIASLKAGICRMDFLAQMTHSVTITVDGDKATARTIVHELGRNSSQKSGVCLIGAYHDTLSRRAGRWAFDRREFVVIFSDTAWVAGATGANLP